MANLLRVLIVEDTEDDRVLIAAELQCGNYELVHNCVASDYEGLQRGRVANMNLTPAQALAFIVGDRRKRYDPIVVDAFVEIAGLATMQAVPVAEEHVATPRLRSDRVLAQDLLTPNRILLSSRDPVLDESLIEKIRGYEQIDAAPIDGRVRVAADLLVRQ